MEEKTGEQKTEGEKLTRRFVAVHTGDSKNYQRFALVSKTKSILGNIYLPKGVSLNELAVDLISEGDEEYALLSEIHKDSEIERKSRWSR
jgi:hypothetical protein